MGFLEFIIWWTCTGTILCLMYLFLYHHGPESWIEYQAYYEEEKNNKENSFKDIKRTGQEYSATVAFIIISALIPPFPIFMLLHDLSIKNNKS